MYVFMYVCDVCMCFMYMYVCMYLCMYLYIVAAFANRRTGVRVMDRQFRAICDRRFQNFPTKN